MDNRTECTHERTETIVTGNFWFDGYESRDDIQEETICLDCGAKITEPVHQLTQEQWDNLKVEF